MNEKKKGEEKESRVSANSSLTVTPSIPISFSRRPTFFFFPSTTAPTTTVYSWQPFQVFQLRFLPLPLIRMVPKLPSLQVTPLKMEIGIIPKMNCLSVRFWNPNVFRNQMYRAGTSAGSPMVGRWWWLSTAMWGTRKKIVSQKEMRWLTLVVVSHHSEELERGWSHGCSQG